MGGRFSTQAILRTGSRRYESILRLEKAEATLLLLLALLLAAALALLARLLARLLLLLLAVAAGATAANVFGHLYLLQRFLFSWGRASGG